MRIYNTLTKKVDELAPINGGQVGIYTCGPTVYNNIHIGNLASFIYADTLKRVIKFESNEVKHVMNFTDVDDKTIKRSREDYPDLDPMAALIKLTTEYTDTFLNDLLEVGVNLDAYTFVKATDSIESIQNLIKELLDKKIAYISDDGVYFSIEAYKNSGKVYGQLTEITAESTSESRIQNDEYDKNSVHDFALWKKQKPQEPAWDFTYNDIDLKGRPGWHIECSAMSRSNLGQPFDIHTGGVDLIFPHHENEIAQSTAGNDNPRLANVFVHSQHVLVEGQKMSKSLNNFYTLEDIKNKKLDPLAYRLMVLQSHYRNQVHFSWDNLQAAQNRLQTLRAMAVLRWQPRTISHDSTTFALEDVAIELGRILADDLKTPQALAFLNNICDQLLVVHIEQDMVDHFEAMLKSLDDLLGLKLSDVEDISEEQKQQIQLRQQARDKEDWETSDSIRKELEEQGVGIQDNQHGPIWYPL